MNLSTWGAKPLDIAFFLSNQWVFSEEDTFVSQFSYAVDFIMLETSLNSGEKDLNTIIRQIVTNSSLTFLTPKSHLSVYTIFMCQIEENVWLSHLVYVVFFSFFFFFSSFFPVNGRTLHNRVSSQLYWSLCIYNDSFMVGSFLQPIVRFFFSSLDRKRKSPRDISVSLLVRANVTGWQKYQEKDWFHVS